MDAYERPALGEDIVLGTLYNAQEDKFLSTSLFDENIPQDGINVSWLEKRHVALFDSNTYRARLDLCGLNAPLIASFLAEWVKVQGSGRFLLSRDSYNDLNAYRALQYTVYTVKQELSFDSAELHNSLQNASPTRDPTGTHVVTGISWGAKCTITSNDLTHGNADPEEQKRKFAAIVQRLERIDWQTSGLTALFDIVDQVFDPTSQLVAHSDISAASGAALTSMSQIKRELEKLHALVEAGYADAVPLTYILTPINSVLSRTGSVHDHSASIGQLNPEQLDSVVGLFDDFHQVNTKLEQYYKRIKKHRVSVRADHLVDVNDALQDAQAAESNFRTKFEELLASVRAGTSHSHDIQRFLAQFLSGPSSPNHFLSIVNESSMKLDLIELVRVKGETCIPHQDLKVANLDDAYVFYFSNKVTKQSSWEPNLELIMQLLNDKTRSASIIAVDCDTDGTQLEKARISRVKSGEAKTADIIEHRRHEASLCLIRFDAGAVDGTVKDAPSQRKAVKIPCPGQTCSHEPHDWICIKCRIKVEYAIIDGFLYCDCGRAPFRSAGFNCQQDHGPNFVQYKPATLKKLLEDLPTPPEINILILGETGVGKSTFINSFVNYLSYQNLDDALAAKDLNWIIPCSFATQSEAPDGRLVKDEVRIGQDKDEHDGSKGQSATQQATVYPLYFGGGLIRLIDTPGIGDTRGPDQDRKNMINILSVLRNYEKLHGILILLKPNNARLTIMFKFCVKELLTQLHRHAAENMVFGFTNTRGSNYQAGDTFQPLETLLKDYADVIPGLFKTNVYCFDSESFRYLAARLKGVDMGHLEDYRRSWDHSAAEARRMVAHFQTLTPHQVRSTVSLNETRYLISQLIQPMAQITAAIADSVKKNEMQINDLNDTRLSGNELRQKLTLTKTVIDSTPLDKPRTVCSNSRCVQYHADSAGNTVTFHKSMCHDPCCLVDVPPDQVGAIQIGRCWAFDGEHTCRVCGHHWSEHQHVIVEYSERTETSTDPNVEKALTRNTGDAQAKKIQIDALQKQIKELEQEHHMIQESQARFSHYLQQHSITHYNDATIEYYEHLIKDEKSKVSHGGQRVRLEQLEQDRVRYKDFVDAMKKGKQQSSLGALDEDGVYALVAKLYNMKHYGKNLKDCAVKTGQAYAATFRERPYRVRRGGFWSGGMDDDMFRNSTSKSAGRSSTQTWLKDMSQPFWPMVTSKSFPAPKPAKPSKFSQIIKRSPTNDTPSDYGTIATQPKAFGMQGPMEKAPYQTVEVDRGTFDDNDDRWETERNSVRALTQSNGRPPYSNPVRNPLLEAGQTPSSPQSPSSPQGAGGGYGDLNNYGQPVPVMFVPGDPNPPHGPEALKRSKKKWFKKAGIKAMDKFTGKG